MYGLHLALVGMQERDETANYVASGRKGTSDR